MRNKFKKLKIGIEVECIADKDKIPFIEVGSYHCGKILKDKNKNSVKGWVVETDASISRGRRFRNPKGMEFVSVAFKSRRDFFKGIDDFAKCLSSGGQYELKEVLEINSSCGCHIHLSMGKHKFAKKMHSHLYEQAQKTFFNLIKKSTLPEKVKNSVLKQYYRDYSRKCNMGQFNKNRQERGSDRNVEWNFSSERSGRGLEWRSFNVRDVETWKDFKLLMSIAFKSLEPLFLGLVRWKKGNIYTKMVDFSETIKNNDIITIKKIENTNNTIPINTITKDEKKVVYMLDKDENIIVKEIKKEDKIGVRSWTNMLNSVLMGE